MNDDAQAVAAAEGRSGRSGAADAFGANDPDHGGVTEYTRAESGSGADPASSAAPPSAPMIVDVPIKISGIGGAVKVVLGWVLWFAAFVAIVLAVESTFSAVGLAPSFLIKAIIALILTSIVLGAVPWLQRRRERRRVVRLVASHAFHGNLALVADHVMRRRKWWSRTTGVETLVTTLAKSYRTGTTLRFCRPKDAFVVRPIAVEFEFRPLAENDPSFAELRAATAPADAKDIRMSDEGNLLRTMWRNVHLKQGTTSLFIIVLLLAWAVWRAYDGGQVRAPVFIWSAALLAKLFWPVTRSMGAFAWFLVPGGAAVDLGVLARKHPTKRVVLLTPRDSVLAVYQANRYKWICFVAQGELPPLERVATRAEVEMLLAAWTSPVEPPSEELLNSVISPQ